MMKQLTIAAIFLGMAWVGEAGDENFIMDDGNFADENGNFQVGDQTSIYGSDNTNFGDNRQIYGDNQYIYGDNQYSDDADQDFDQSNQWQQPDGDYTGEYLESQRQYTQLAQEQIQDRMDNYGWQQ